MARVNCGGVRNALLDICGISAAVAAGIALTGNHRCQCEKEKNKSCHCIEFSLAKLMKTIRLQAQFSSGRQRTARGYAAFIRRVDGSYGDSLRPESSP